MALVGPAPPSLGKAFLPEAISAVTVQPTVLLHLDFSGYMCCAANAKLKCSYYFLNVDYAI